MLKCVFCSNDATQGCNVTIGTSKHVSRLCGGCIRGLEKVEMKIEGTKIYIVGEATFANQTVSVKNN